MITATLFRLGVGGDHRAEVTGLAIEVNSFDVDVLCAIAMMIWLFKCEIRGVLRLNLLKTHLLLL